MIECSRSWFADRKRKGIMLKNQTGGIVHPAWFSLHYRCFLKEKRCFSFFLEREPGFIACSSPHWRKTLLCDAGEKRAMNSTLRISWLRSNQGARFFQNRTALCLLCMKSEEIDEYLVFSAAMLSVIIKIE